MTNSATTTPPVLAAEGGWESLLEAARWSELERVLPDYLRARRWFGGKARPIETTRVQAAIPLRYDDAIAYITLIRVSYDAGAGELYVLPLAFAEVARAAELLRDMPHAIVAHVAPGALFDALYDPAFCAALLEQIATRAQLLSPDGDLVAETTSSFARLRGPSGEPLAPKVSTAEQSNSSIIFGQRLIMKLFRRLEPGLNPDLEIGRFLTERGSFEHIPPLAGAIEYRRDGEPMSLALLQGFVPNHGDAWYYTLATIAESFGRAMVAPGDFEPPALPELPLLDLVERQPPPAVRMFIGGYLDAAELLGRRTGELHLALGRGAENPNFAPEPCGAEFRQATYASMERRAQQSFELLQQGIGGLPAELREDAQQILSLQKPIEDRLRAALEQPISAQRIRIHGDYHLGQVLYTGSDFYIIDFEGEPARPLSERRQKSLALQDIAGMLRSFHYAPYAALLGQAPGVTFDDAQIAALEPWARLWHSWVSGAFLRSYLGTTGAAAFLPQSRAELQALLDAYLLDKAVYELRYELNNRPSWARIPIEGILQLVR